MPWATVREAPGNKAEDLLLQVHYVPWVVLGHSFMPPVQTLAFTLEDTLILVGYWNIATEPSLVEGCAEHCPQCALTRDMAFCLAFAFVISQI